MSSTPKLTGWGDVQWTGHYYKNGTTPCRAGGRPCMSYEIVGILSSKRLYDVVEGVLVTNGTCDGVGWDVWIHGEKVDHKHTKSEAQSVAEGYVR